jgi:DNA modification methylase
MKQVEVIEEKEVDLDFWGSPIVENLLLRDRFIEPPFSILDTKSGSWQNRKRLWKRIGIKSEVGRDATSFSTAKSSIKYDYMPNVGSDISIFDPALCEVLYHWFCPKGGTILDPFAGGSVRGIVANYLGFKYTGVDIRPEQIQSNIEQGKLINDALNQPIWHCGDSNEVLDTITNKFDLVFSCPPYADLEVYSDLPGDISNMPYLQFMDVYKSIINKACSKLKIGGYACFVVGEVRDKKGNYIGFVPDTIKAFTSAGVKFYNEAILLNSIGTASIRANNSMKNDKLVKVHQNVLVFKKI